ncbi:MAG: hypothetical protein M3076_07605 [Actinomycetota bacterium]|nr:hypothetical protein [Actinomycetota bacterium]
MDEPPVEDDWSHVASTLLSGVSQAADRDTALEYCRTASSRLTCRHDIWLLGTRLSDLGKRIGGRRERAIAAALAACFYKTAVPINPLLPFAASGLAVLAAGAAVLLLALGQVGLGVLACIAFVVLLDRARAFRHRLATWADDRPVEPPSTEDFLRIESIRSLPVTREPASQPER